MKLGQYYSKKRIKHIAKILHEYISFPGTETQQNLQNLEFLNIKNRKYVAIKYQLYEFGTMTPIFLSTIKFCNSGWFHSKFALNYKEKYTMGFISPCADTGNTLL